MCPTLRDSATRLLDGQGQQRARIVLGHLNDEPLAATTQILLEPPGLVIDTRGFDLDNDDDAQRLWNLAPRILPENRRFSRVFNGRPEPIDHILVSHALVHHVDSVTSGTADLPSVTTEPGERRDATGSDHAPVMARFDVG
jgi:endonuclease/exonuclease/phosphatase family metal-dependent hydrolase